MYIHVHIYVYVIYIYTHKYKYNESVEDICKIRNITDFKKIVSLNYLYTYIYIKQNKIIKNSIRES